MVYSNIIAGKCEYNERANIIFASKTVTLLLITPSVPKWSYVFIPHKLNSIKYFYSGKTGLERPTLMK